MSASEKLKTLREWDGLGDPWLSDEGKRALARALPQIVAVVEMAENAREIFEREGYLTDYWDAALAALEEALG